MSNKTKIIAMYLPQYHCIPENDLFWGKGVTDWVTVKKAKPLFPGHQQPKVPFNGYYYDLSTKQDVEWQCKLAKEYGVYGFGIYHYWFNNDKNLLTKPAEIIHENKDIDMNYFFAWDNLSWRRTWSNLSGNAWAPTLENGKQDGPATLIEYILGEEKDWKKHYDYLRPYFLDKRYIKKDNKPIFIIFYYSDGISKMCDFWNKLAQKDGFDGMMFIFKRSQNVYCKTEQPSGITLFNYEPMFNGWQNICLLNSVISRCINKIKRYVGIKPKDPGLRILDYDKVWKRLLKSANSRFSASNVYHGAFVSYDDTPRRGNKKGIVIKGDTPEKFYNYMKQLGELSENQGKEFVFLTAWNEWGEGACLEPNKDKGMAYLEALRRLTKG